MGRAGSAYVFVRSNGVWSQQKKLTASDATADDNFGYSVAISGHTAVVGASITLGSVNYGPGSAYVYVRSTGQWSQQKKLTASDGADGDAFGVSVAISGDTVVVGASSDDTAAGKYAGSAYIYGPTIIILPEPGADTDAAGELVGHTLTEETTGQTGLRVPGIGTLKVPSGIRQQHFQSGRPVSVSASELARNRSKGAADDSLYNEALVAEGAISRSSGCPQAGMNSGVMLFRRMPTTFRNLYSKLVSKKGNSYE